MRRILCAIGRHSYETVQELTPWSRRIGCPHCRRTWRADDDVPVVTPWSDSLRSMYADLLGVELKPPRWESSSEGGES